MDNGTTPRPNGMNQPPQPSVPQTPLGSPQPPKQPLRPKLAKKSKALYIAVGIVVALLVAVAGTNAGWFGDSGKTGGNNKRRPGAYDKPDSGLIVDDSYQRVNNDKEVCVEHSKLCFTIPADWSSEFSTKIDEDYRRDNPSVKGHINIEKLSLIDTEGRKKISFTNRYGSEDFNGAWGVGGTCVGQMERMVVNYQLVSFTNHDEKFNNNWVVQAVVDTLDPTKMDTEDSVLRYEAHIELAPFHPQANRPGDYMISCEPVVLRGVMPGLTQPSDAVKIDVMLGDANKPLANRAAAIAELHKPENQQAFNILASIHQK